MRAIYAKKDILNENVLFRVADKLKCKCEKVAGRSLFLVPSTAGLVGESWPDRVLSLP
jgi:hypothetical protein